MPLRRWTAVLFLFVLAAPALPVHAQDAALPSPEAFLGYALGTQFTPHHRVVDYVRHVAEASPRVEVERYGTTYEGRPLLVAYVTTPEQMERLDAIRQDNLRRAGLLEGAPAVEDAPAEDAPAEDAPAEDAPALVWLSYNVHGNEAVSTEAAMKTLYALADPQNARAQTWLENTVVIIDPCVNPDGRQRYVQWYRQVRGQTANPAPAAREHHEPWPGGRTNHYYFDLNRDWAWGVQQATRRRLALYNRWMPHVHVDFHEQSVDAPYYFAPAAEPFHEAITDWQRRFQTTIGENNARYFDEEGWLYFTGEVFDLFYPGYGDTWPLFNGAIGMTYEQGGSGRAGLAIETASGDTLTLRQRIAHHYTAGLSTIEAAAEHRARVVEEFADYFDAQDDPPGRYAAYVVKRAGRADAVDALAAHLGQQGIRYGYATEERTATGFHYATGETEDFAVAPGDLVVSLHQPKAVLAHVLFEPAPALADSLTYDITAWALPYAYGLDAYATEARLTPGARTPPARSAPDAVAGEPAYAYLAEWSSLDDARLLASLLKAGVQVRAAQESFALDGDRYTRGTLVIARADNEALGEDFGETVRAVADSLGQPVVPVQTGFVSTGPDFGSANVVFIEKPRVAVLAGEPLSPYAVGEVWHFLDRQLGYPATLLYPDDMSMDILRDYDVLVLPDGNYTEALRERLDGLAGWVRGGGRLIALEGAVGFLAEQDGFAIEPKDTAEEDTTAAPEELLRTYARREREAASGNVPGAIFRARLDPTHPLAYGYGEHYFTLKVGEAAYAYLKDGWNVAALREEAHVAGFAGAEAREKLANTLVFGAQPMDSGSVVYLVDNPLFRGFWQNGKLLFANALFMVGQD